MKHIRADKFRFIVAGLIEAADGKILLCKKPSGKGVFPGQWACAGGGVDEGETLEEALEREVQEEVGLEIENIEPLFFWDDLQPKFDNGLSIGDIYMVYLIFRCRAKTNEPTLNDEFEEYRWVDRTNLSEYDLNPPTREVFARLGYLSR